MENIQTIFLWNWFSIFDFQQVFGLYFLNFLVFSAEKLPVPDRVLTWIWFFFLRFTGYRKEPSTEAELNNVLNNFTVKNCEIILTDRPKKNVFIIRGLHLTTVVERTFHTDSEAERWEIHSSPTIHFHYYKKDPKNFIESILVTASAMPTALIIKSMPNVGGIG